MAVKDESEAKEKEGSIHKGRKICLSGIIRYILLVLVWEFQKKAELDENVPKVTCHLWACVCTVYIRPIAPTAIRPPSPAFFFSAKKTRFGKMCFATIDSPLWELSRKHLGAGQGCLYVCGIF